MSESRFRFEIIGYYDLASQVDFILKETHRKKLNYVGFSQGKNGTIEPNKSPKILLFRNFSSIFLGSTQFFILNSMRLEYNDKFIEGKIRLL